MPRGMYKSGRFRKIFVKTPGGSTRVHYRLHKPSKAHCAGCGKVLAGVPQGRKMELRALPKNQRRPERPYGGVYCSACTRSIIRSKARELA